MSKRADRAWGLFVVFVVFSAMAGDAGGNLWQAMLGGGIITFIASLMMDAGDARREADLAEHDRDQARTPR